MDRHVDAAVVQLFFQFLGEQALAADFRQRPVLNLVTGCLDDNDLDQCGVKIMRLA